MAEKKLSVKVLREMILAHREDPEPFQTIYAILGQFEGKAFGKRVLKALEEATGLRFWLEKKTWGQTYLNWMEPQTHASDRMFVSYETTFVKVDTAFIQEHNKSDVQVAERNAHKEAMASDEAKLQELVKAIDTFKEARASLKELLNGAFGAARYFIEEECQLNMEERR